MSRETGIFHHIKETTREFQRTRQNKQITQKMYEFQSIDWRTLLTQIQFPGNVENGAVLMEAFIQGGTDILQALQKRRMIEAGYTVPSLDFTRPKDNDPKNYFSAKCDIYTNQNKKGEIYTVLERLSINPEFLINQSKLAIHDRYSMETAYGAFSFLGRPIDFWYLIGLEETAHSVYQWNYVRRSKNNPVSSSGISLLEASDGHPVEYHALGWQIRSLMDRNDMPEDIKNVTLQLLRDRMGNAIRYRDSHRRDYDLPLQKQKSSALQARDALRAKKHPSLLL